jgi:hypothetical protein
VAEASDDQAPDTTQEDDDAEGSRESQKAEIFEEVDGLWKQLGFSGSEP